MKAVGSVCKTLFASRDLQKALEEIGQTEHFPANYVVFKAGDVNAGVYLVCKGKICMQVPGMPALDRMFGSASILGLPSTFTANPYSLTAVCTTECELVNVGREKFLGLMSIRIPLCQEAITLLGREIAFILAAYRKHRGLPHQGRDHARLLVRKPRTAESDI